MNQIRLPVDGFGCNLCSGYCPSTLGCGKWAGRKRKGETEWLSPARFHAGPGALTCCYLIPTPYQFWFYSWRNRWVADKRLSLYPPRIDSWVWWKELTTGSLTGERVHKCINFYYYMPGDMRGQQSEYLRMLRCESLDTILTREGEGNVGHWGASTEFQGKANRPLAELMGVMVCDKAGLVVVLTSSVLSCEQRSILLGCWKPRDGGPWQPRSSHKVCLYTEGGGQQKPLPASALFQVSSAQNNRHTTAADVGLACTEPLRWQNLDLDSVALKHLQNKLHLIHCRSRCSICVVYKKKEVEGMWWSQQVL